jgi:DNA mismatch endonuclease Vsr
MEQFLKTKLPDGRFLHVPEIRSKTMAAIKARGNRTTEGRFRSALARGGIRGWIVQPRGFVGNPDFYFPANKLVVFLDGCFWHGCPECGHTPKTNSDYWGEKIKRNRARDFRNQQILKSQGLEVIRFWEHELIRNTGAVIATVSASVYRDSVAVGRKV